MNDIEKHNILASGKPLRKYGYRYKVGIHSTFGEKLEPYTIWHYFKHHEDAETYMFKHANYDLTGIEEIGENEY